MQQIPGQAVHSKRSIIIQRNLTRLLIAGLALVIGSMVNAAQGDGSRHIYAVSVDDELASLTVRATLAKPSSRVALHERSASRRVKRLRECGSDKPLKLSRGRIKETVSCFEYEVRIRNESKRVYGADRNLYAKDKVSSTDYWLLRPTGSSLPIRVTFDMPEGINVSVPWAPIADNQYEFIPRTLSSTAITAFGPFDKFTIKLTGGELRVSILNTGYEARAAKMKEWLQAAGQHVVKAYGRFPAKSVQVVIVPVNGRSNEAVPFGRVIRDGGESVQFFVNTARPLEEFLKDWTATHEFSHLLMPYVEDRWVSEGFASYYQNVLLARGAVYSPRKAWQKLYEGFQRGGMSARGMSPHSARMRNGGLMKVYWSGAAVALIADVKLREMSQGEVSLDDVMKKLRYCCIPSRKSYSDREFFAKLDEISPHPVFMDLYDKYAHASGFPDYSEALADAGVVVRNGRVRLSEDGAIGIMN